MIWPFKRAKPVQSKPTLKWYPADASFREYADLVGWAHGMLQSANGQSLQAYLFAGVPESIAYRGDKVDAIQACQEYFRIVGYLECLNRLQDAARMLPVKAAEVEADYDQTPPGQQPET